MHDWGWGFALGHGLFGILLWVLLIAVAVALVVKLTGLRSRGGNHSARDIWRVRQGRNRPQGVRTENEGSRSLGQGTLSTPQRGPARKCRRPRQRPTPRRNGSAELLFVRTQDRDRILENILHVNHLYQHD
jgi:hypothetical protein